MLFSIRFNVCSLFHRIGLFFFLKTKIEFNLLQVIQCTRFYNFTPYILKRSNICRYSNPSTNMDEPIERRLLPEEHFICVKMSRPHCIGLALDIGALSTGLHDPIFDLAGSVRWWIVKVCQSSDMDTAVAEGAEQETPKGRGRFGRHVLVYCAIDSSQRYRTLTFNHSTIVYKNHLAV